MPERSEGNALHYERKDSRAAGKRNATVAKYLAACSKQSGYQVHPSIIVKIRPVTRRQLLSISVAHDVEAVLPVACGERRLRLE